MRDKVTLWKVGATEKFFASSFCPSGYDISAAAGTRAFSQWDRFGIAALGETLARQEKAEAAELFHHSFAAFFTRKVCRLIEAAFQTA